MAADNKKSNNALAMTLLKGRTFIVLIILMIFFSITANNLSLIHISSDFVPRLRIFPTKIWQRESLLLTSMG